MPAIPPEFLKAIVSYGAFSVGVAVGMIFKAVSHRAHVKSLEREIKQVWEQNANLHKIIENNQLRFEKLHEKNWKKAGGKKK